VKPREKGSLPRAYWRIDPNIDQTHPRYGEMTRLICVAGRQPRRGRFKNRVVFAQVFGVGAAKRALARRDVVEHLTEDDCRYAPEHARFCDLDLPHLYVDGWDEWQESDLDVGSRMRRIRTAGAERTRRWRERHAGHHDASRSVPSNAVTVTSQPVTSDAPVTTGVRRQASGEDTSVATQPLETAPAHMQDVGRSGPREDETQLERLQRLEHETVDPIVRDVLRRKIAHLEAAS
jgi:hypothetical protein